MAASRTTRTSSKPSSSALAEPVQRLRGVGADSAKLLDRLGIHTVEDLLWHLPARYEDYSKVVPLGSLRPEAEQTVVATVGHIATIPGRRGPPRTEIELRDESGVPSRHKAVWFGNAFIRQRVQEGQTVRISGKPKWFGHGLSFTNPTLEPADREAVQTARIVPVYRLTEGLKEGYLRRWLLSLVTSQRLALVADPLPPDVRDRQGLPPIADALRQVHFPEAPQELFRARRRLAFDELFILQLATAQRRSRWVAEARARTLAVTDAELDAWIAELPFALTGAQRRSLAQIRGDLARAVPMSRLLEGDVGSGKTVVAALAMRIAFRCGMQSALMAPTELLADQHYATLEALFARGGPKVARLSSSTSAGERERILERLERGELDAVVGTHALIQEGVSFPRLALAVIDEQHRFGVEQRATLRQKGTYPHVLLTTATPIPQTLWQTLNRDLDVSVLDEMPAGRREIRTEVRTPEALPRAWPWVAERVRSGEQAFVVCPRIDPADEESDTLFEKSWQPSAVATFDELRSGALSGVRVGLVHGRMPQKERDAVMTRFRDRELDVLVATTVIEVGIDIPHATVMVVLGAERFGLAQLHQLRGRVGRRAEQKAFCVLVSPKTDSDRLRAMSERVEKDATERLLNGFELAERDLQIRGPGQFLGQEQSGIRDQLRLVDLTDIDPRLLDDAAREADKIVAVDPELERTEHRGLRQAVDALWERYAFV
ncbi:MAG: ATP-dependent DNA helicase RecG [Chloroflexota bacterium]|nr:ATP-dependent DNA helicase RecG [Chloroflexota bacterium]